MIADKKAFFVFDSGASYRLVKNASVGLIYADIARNHNNVKKVSYPGRVKLEILQRGHAVCYCAEDIAAAFDLLEDIDRAGKHIYVFSVIIVKGVVKLLHRRMVFPAPELYKLRKIDLPVLVAAVNVLLHFTKLFFSFLV